jgi:hypothetical protein
VQGSNLLVQAAESTSLALNNVCWFRFPSGCFQAFSQLQQLQSGLADFGFNFGWWDSRVLRDCNSDGGWAGIASTDE